MTDQKIDLALAFLQSHPDAAAGILEQQPLEQVVAFIQTIPHTHAALVLEKMLPHYTARLCNALDPITCAGFLSTMPASLVAAILRCCGKKVRKKILEHLPEKTKLL